MGIRFSAAWNYFRVLAKLRSCIALEDAAIHTDVLCPEEEISAAPAVFLDGQLDKVEKSTIYTTVDYEVSRVKGGKRVLPPTLIHEIRNVALMDGLFVKGHRTKFVAARHQIKVEQREPKNLPSAALTTVWTGIRFFGHWLQEGCSTYLLARDFAEPLCIRTPDWPDKAKYAAYFEQDWAPTDRAFIERLFMFDDLSQNSLKRRHYEALREKIRRRFKPAKPGGIVYLKRGTSGEPRAVENEDDVIEALSKQGVAILEAETTPLEELIARLLGTSMLITIEGSQMNHAIYTLADAGGVIVLQPPQRFNNSGKDWAQCLGMTYGFVVGDICENGFTIDPNDLLRTIEMAYRCLQAH